MLTCLKLSSLAFECLSYRLEHNAKERHYGTELRRSSNEEMYCYQITELNK